MPYPYYTPYNYNPYSYGYQPQQMAQQPIQQPQMVQQPAPQQTMPTPTSLIWVSSDRDAAMYPTAPNNAVALWNQNEPVVYLKQADASGKPSMKVYDLVERAETPSDGLKSEGGKNTPYAMKEDVAALASVVKGFDGMIASMKGDIEKMSGDLYGIAGKKKSAKKTESEEETE